MYTTCRDKDFTLAFVCTKNACRSQIAQAWARKYAPPGLRVVSAGTHPAAEIDTEVVRIMKDQFNIDLSGQQPKTLTAVGRIDVLVMMGIERSSICYAEKFMSSCRPRISRIPLTDIDRY